MLNDAYFETLDDCPSPARLELLPIWARDYERGLRAAASWWSNRQKKKPRFPSYDTPPLDRWRVLPMWCQDWFRTLIFEIEWQRQQATPTREQAREIRFARNRERHNHKTKEGSNAHSQSQA